MSGKILRTAVIGLGRIAWSDHIPGLKRHPGYEVCAVVDPLEERCRETCAEFNVRASYGSLETMLEIEKPDLAVIASPTTCHSEQTIRSLEAGAHVFCDKPAALNAAEFMCMAECAARCGRKMTVYQPQRFTAESLAFQEILGGGKLGPLFGVKLFCGNYARRNDWQCFRKNGGGMLNNYGVHFIDQCMYCLQEKFTPKYCSLRSIVSAGDADDVVKALFTTPSGIEVDIEINQAAAQKPFVRALFGKYGSAVLRTSDEPWELRWYDPAALAPAVADQSMAASGRRYPGEKIPFVTESFSCSRVLRPPVDIFLENLYDHLVNDAVPLVSNSETLRLMTLLDRCRLLAENQE